MNFSVEDLRDLIRSGKTNAEIKKYRLETLKSDEYKKLRYESIKEQGTDQVLFYDGFIDSEFNVSFKGNMATNVIYHISNDIDFYDYLIDYIRANMDKKGMSFKGLIQLVRNYFSLDINTPYGKVSKLLRDFQPNNRYFARENLPYVIHYYRHSDYAGSLEDFSELYLDNLRYSYLKDESLSMKSEYFLNSINWEEVEENSDIELDLSQLKGAGIAACTEYSMLIQNALAFLGYECYMLGGTLSGVDFLEAHNFNAYLTKKGEYKIVDASQCCWSNPLVGINSVGDLSNMDNVQVDNLFGLPIKYSSGHFKNKAIK